VSEIVTKCEADKLNEKQLHDIEFEIESSKSKLIDLDNKMTLLESKIQSLKYAKVNDNADVNFKGLFFNGKPLLLLQAKSPRRYLILQRLRFFISKSNSVDEILRFEIWGYTKGFSVCNMSRMKLIIFSAHSALYCSTTHFK
jgi:hypothetical protein